MKLYVWLLGLFLFIGIAVIPGCASAQVTSFKSTKLQIFQINYVGDKEKSFSESGTGLGVEAYSDWGRPWGRIYTKVRGTESSGTQSFLDGSTATSCSYTFYQGQFEAGLAVLPIPTRDTGISLFISAGPTLGYNWLSLNSSSTLTSLKSADSSLSYGYAAGMGLEWTLSKTQGKRSVLTGEITYRSETASLAGQTSFNLGGLAIHLGYGW